MCAGAVVLARLDRLVFATPDPKAGACGSLLNAVRDNRLNHCVEVTRGVRSSEGEDVEACVDRIENAVRDRTNGSTSNRQ